MIYMRITNLPIDVFIAQIHLLRAIDDGSGVFLVLLDLSSAFPTIDHDIFLDRLKSNIGLFDNSLSWFAHI